MNPLKAGDEMKCWRCSGWHVLVTESETTDKFTDDFLYILCAGGKYYAGKIGLPADQPTRPAGG